MRRTMLIPCYNCKNRSDLCSLKCKSYKLYKIYRFFNLRLTKEEMEKLNLIIDILRKVIK